MQKQKRTFNGREYSMTRKAVKFGDIKTQRWAYLFEIEGLPEDLLQHLFFSGLNKEFRTGKKNNRKVWPLMLDFWLKNADKILAQEETEFLDLNVKIPAKLVAKRKLLGHVEMFLDVCAKHRLSYISLEG